MSALVNHTNPQEGSHSNADKRIDFLRGEIGLEAFSNFMRSCELPHLASQEVFNIFDINRDGTIELKEFLLVGLLSEYFRMFLKFFVDCKIN